MNRIPKVSALNITSNNGAITLNQIYLTRALLFKITMVAGATADAVITWGDYFANIALALKTINLQVGTATPVNISGQMLSYFAYVNGGTNHYEEFTTSGTIAAKNTQVGVVPLDMTVVHSSHPIDALLTPQAQLILTFTQASADANVFSNAGVVIQSVSVDTYQCYEMGNNLKPGYVPALKWLTELSKTLTASLAGQDVPFSVPKSNKLSKLLMLMGSAGGQGNITPVEPGISVFTLDIAGFIPYQSIDGRILKAYLNAFDEPISQQFVVVPTSAVSGVNKGPTGFYTAYATNPVDSNQIHQLYPVENDGINKVTIDTPASTVVIEMLIESIAGEPEIVPAA